MKQRLLTEDKTLVVSAIHGLGSVGKSTLAAALAHDPDIQNHFCDGVLWATLGQEPDVLSLLGVWVQRLGDYNYRATSIDATSDHLRTLLFDKAVLLVVDDAWIDKSKGWSHVEAFKVGGSRCCMLVTTRDASVGNFLGASTFALDVMTKEQALELIAKKLQQHNKSLQETDKKLVQTFALAVGYLPLALELAAAQVVSGASWEVLIKDINQEIARLKSLKDPGTRNISDDEKYKKLSLEASLNLSIKRLDKNDQECFATLGVLPEDAIITQKMTATLWDMDERDAADTLQYLQSQALLLRSVSLSDDTLTYRLHDLFHDLARNLLTAPQQPKRQGDLIGLGIKWEDAHAQLLEKYKQQTENNYWHTLPNDGYIHQYLVWHLEKAGKIEEIHQLLREESVNGKNGWYEARERLGQTAGFLTDVARVLELVEADFDKNPSKVISLQCRYGLIMASLNSLSANIPKELLVVLVKNKFWQPEQGLAYAMQKQDLEDKANSLIALSDYLPETLKQQALQTASEIVPKIYNRDSCEIVLSNLAEKLQNEHLYNEVVKVARQTQNEYSHANLLSFSPETLPEDLHNKVLEAIRKTDDESFRNKALLSLAEKLQNEHSYNEALEVAHQIQDKGYRVKIISSLAKELQNEHLYNEVLEVARQIQDESSRVRVLSFLVEQLPENLYNEVLEIAYQIQDELYTAKVLSFFIIQLQSQELYKEVLEILLKIPDEFYRADILSSLAENLPENLYSEALRIACQIQNEEHRAYALSFLFEKLPENLYNEALKITYQINDEEYRANVLSSLTEKLSYYSYDKELIKAHPVQKKGYHASVLSSLTGKLAEHSYNEQLETARKIQDEGCRASFLSSLVKELPETLYDEALKISRQIQDENHRACVLSVFINVILFKKQENGIYEMWLEILKSLYKIKRPEFKENLDILAPVIFRLGGKDAIMEVANAIQDVVLWWR